MVAVPRQAVHTAGAWAVVRAVSAARGAGTFHRHPEPDLDPDFDPDPDFDFDPDFDPQLNSNPNPRPNRNLQHVDQSLRLGLWR